MTDSVRSYGGVAGESAVTEDLERGARIIESAAQLLSDAGRELAQAQGYADAAHRRGSEPTRQAALGASDALGDAQYGVFGTRPTAAEANDLADRLQRVARGFLEAEQAAMSHVSAGTRAASAMSSMWGTGFWVARHVWALAVLAASGPATALGVSAGVAGAIRPDGLPPTTGFLNKDTVQMLAGGLDSSVLGFESQVYALAAAAAALEGLFREGHASTVRPRGESYPARNPRGLEDVMNGVLAEQFRMDGSVSIETVTHADGSRSHIVTIPGTEDWTPWDDNPIDAQANLTGVVGATSDAQAAIVDAMRAAGIEPGEGVMLAGHSQGGINAVALASRPEFLAEFNVTHVVTAGSPVGRMDLPPSVNALHLEHSEDIVSGFDAVANPDTATRTTVERDLTASGDAEMERLGRDMAGAHDLVSYRSTAGLVDQSLAGTSATLWRESAAGFFTGESSTLTEYEPAVMPAD